MIAILKTGCGCTQTLDLGQCKAPPTVIKQQVVDRVKPWLAAPNSKITLSLVRCFRMGPVIAPETIEYYEEIHQ